MVETSAAITATFCVYLALMLGIGAWAYQSTKSSSGYSGVIVGGVNVVVWKQLSGGLFDLYEIVPGILFASIAIVVASLATAPPAADIRAGFERFKQALDSAD